MESEDQPKPNMQSSRRNFARSLGIISATGLAGVIALRPKKAAALAILPNCFLKGTRIQTEHGARPIEDLAIGDRLPTAFNGLQPIEWIARNSFRRDDRTKPWPVSVRPVRIARGALADNVPSADLYLTGTHAVMVDGVLVQAGSLVNGATIATDPASGLDELVYFHIKLETHDVITAEGAPCESLLMTGEAYTNFSEYHRLYGEPAALEPPCLPILGGIGRKALLASRLRSAAAIIVDRRQQLDRIRDRLEERAMGQVSTLA